MSVQPTTPRCGPPISRETGEGVIDHTSREYQWRPLGRARGGDPASSPTGGLVTSDLTMKQAVEAELQWEPRDISGSPMLQ
jgi:hypothetical protein